MCNDGSYCCNDDALCCSKKAGKFVDAKGNTIPNPFQSTSATIAQTASAPAVAATTVTATPTATPTAESTHGLSAASKGAIGGLVGAIVLIAIAVGVFIWRKRREVRHFKEDTLAKRENQATQRYNLPPYDQRGVMGFAPAELRGVDGAITPERRELSSSPMPR